jgi:hypothetical protein
MDKLMQMAQAAGVGGGGGMGGQVPQGMPPGGGGGGGGLEQLMQMAGPMLSQMGPQSKMALGGALQDPKIQQMVIQALQNPQMLQQLFDQATQGMGGGGGGPDMAAMQGGGGMLQGMPQEMPPEAGGGGGGMSTEDELQAIYQMMGKGTEGMKAQDKKKSAPSKGKSDDDSDDD